jgi:hypothetical protein
VGNFLGEVLIWRFDIFSRLILKLRKVSEVYVCVCVCVYVCVCVCVCECLLLDISRFNNL